MSEEILKALMQLFAIIARQDEGVEHNELAFVESFLKSQLKEDDVKEYLGQFKTQAGYGEEQKSGRLVAVNESVRVLGICRKINKRLDQKQKVVVLVRLFELVNADKKFSDQRMAIIRTVAEVFKFSSEEYISIERFVTKDDLTDLDDASILIINDRDFAGTFSQHILTESLHGNILILRVKSTELYFLRYTGKQDIFLNGLGVYNNRIYLFATGSTIKLPKGKPVYYSDVVSKYLSDISTTRLSFNVKNVSYKFPTGNLGLRDISFSATQGKLVGIMGASGAGKTTLLNLLSGIASPSEGAVIINGINFHEDHEKLEGVIGYIPQDDLLIEELTVFQNLYYNAKLCFRDRGEEEIVELVNKTLRNLGLYERRDLKVGSPMNKMISGGQRKRLNIALELIREPSILFVDEPTSGLSSRDSENVMDLLSELTLKGKLIFVVIHQPSSDIYKMFDSMIILDQGGHMIYYGNPVEAIVYFKQIDNQINSEVGECPTCGNVTPELIFNIVEAQVVDEFGQYTNTRKVAPEKWDEHYRIHRNEEELLVADEEEEPPRGLHIPKWLRQLKIYTIRDVLSKISNTQYIVLNLLEAPLLGFILSYIIRYIADPHSSVYIFFDNENIPPYIFMSIVVALFLGLTVSAEEIFRDRKILKREKFLNLSRSAYLFSKIAILTTISAIQALLFVLVGNSILGIADMYFQYWLVLFSVFVFANMMGLIISSSFNSAVTIYILIPLLMIPQMALGGAMFSFDKLNRVLGSVGKVPLIAEIMASRWAYESLMVQQFKKNRHQQVYFDLDFDRENANYKTVYYYPELRNILSENLELIDDYGLENDSVNKILDDNFSLLKNELKKESMRLPSLPFEDFDLLAQATFDEKAAAEINNQIDEWDNYYSRIFYKADSKKQKVINYLDEKEPGYTRNLKKDYHNEKLQDIVWNAYEKNNILRYKDNLIRQYRPIYNEPDYFGGIGFRSHFYAPKKVLFGTYFDTFWFNIIVIWLMSILLYIPLYYDHLKKIIEFFGGFDWERLIFWKKS
jgi:ABC-type multidrug transport system ATPase subunit